MLQSTSRCCIHAKQMDVGEKDICTVQKRHVSECHKRHTVLQAEMEQQQFQYGE